MRNTHKAGGATNGPVSVRAWAALVFAVVAANACAQNEPVPAQRLILPAAEVPRRANQPAPLLPNAVREAPEVEPDDKEVARRARAGLQIRAAITNRLDEERRAEAPPVTAALNTSEELEHLLDKATQVAAERPDLAPVLWQRILDEGANTFARAPSSQAPSRRRAYELYRPFSNVTLRSMIDAGPEALRHYRLHSDGPARALMARQGAEREAALGEVVRRYFLTTVGDEAAFELACRQLERGDFTSADQLLERLAMFPDGSVSADEIAIRRAVTKARLGRAEAAKEFVETLGPEVSALQPVLLAEIANQQGRGIQIADAAPTPTVPPHTIAAAQLEPQWEYRPYWTLKGVKASSNNQAIMSGIGAQGRPMVFVRQAGGNYVQTTLEDKDIPDLTLTQLASSWKSAGWRPAARPVAAEGRIYLKSQLRTVCCDADTGQVLWMGRPTRFPMDESTRQLALVAAHGVTLQFPTTTFANGTAPKTMTEIMLFADCLNHRLVVNHGRVFAIEGELETAATRRKVTDNVRNQQMFGMAQPGAPDRHNELACYDAATGRLIWNIGRGTVLKEGASLWSAPLVLGDEVIIATGADNQLGVVALKASDGSLVWKSMLSDLARTSPTAAVALAADDGSIYVAGGGGVLFSIDRVGGALRWAVSYPRVKTNDPTAERRMMIEGRSSPRQQMVLDDNLIVREDGALLLAASDSDHVMAFDVTDGSLLWDSPLPAPVLSGAPGYVVGARGGKIMLANNRWLWSINIRGGKIAWDLPLENSCGRGLLTADALLIPQQRTVSHVDPETGKVLKTTPIETLDAEPVGNLVAAGNQFLAAGAARLMALTPRPPAADVKATAPEESRP